MIADALQGCLNDGFFVLKSTNLHSAKIELLRSVNMKPGASSSGDDGDSNFGIEMSNPACDGSKGQAFDCEERD
jgi:hypothetical protein